MTVCPLTTDATDALPIRTPVPHTRQNGLRGGSRLMVDKLITTRRGNLRASVGVLEQEHTVALEPALAVFLGLAD